MSRSKFAEERTFYLQLCINDKKREIENSLKGHFEYGRTSMESKDVTTIIDFHHPSPADFFRLPLC